MASSKSEYRFLFAGGGTGGHLFPAVAVAEKIKARIPEADILFVGTKSKIEGRVVPKLGYKFKSIWIKGFSRTFTLENILFPIKLIVSLFQSLIINISFRPKVAIGSGGYVSGPAIWGSSVMGAKIILLEQNSFPGVTTRILERYADEIHISYEDSKKYLKQHMKIKVTGNPVRESLNRIDKEEALRHFDLNIHKKTILTLGGSLGAYSINEAMAHLLSTIKEKDLQVIWQTGNIYYDRYKALTSEGIIIVPFINDMNFAYSAADIVIARAGATTIAELLVLGIPSVLIPSPNVAENHQYYNAKSLAEENAAILIEDKDVQNVLTDKLISIIFDSKKLDELSSNTKKFSKPDAASQIAESAIKFADAL
ncbi:MAG TPA: undecaprenyldiphospho-muramoylpentapeptide beta-N-acetylglucosaminyltransferase [Ignavibacteriaceae bacterium]|nr:undecaprenyldiphospho-muramoylpentapeptide beta-N-acetylglucosaminyltransferase [Ignavibacteriaceae bacterium]